MPADLLAYYSVYYKSVVTSRGQHFLLTQYCLT